jgi:hypothetical protein
MAPDEAARVIASAMKLGTIPANLTRLASVLSATLNRLGETEAARICEELLEAITRDSFYAIAPLLLDHLTPQRAHVLARHLASRACSRADWDTVALSRVLADASRDQRARLAA